MHVAKRWIVTSAIGAGALATAGIGVAHAVSAKATHTLTFKSVQLSSANTSKTSFVDVDKDVAKGKKIGGDVLSCKANATFSHIHCHFAAGFKGGIIDGTFNLSQGKDNLHNGKITGGDGKFKGVTGTITGTASGHNNENVVITYHH
jgi:uncharacterized Fe-S center protein